MGTSSTEYYNYMEKKGSTITQNQILKLKTNEEKEVSYVTSTWDEKQITINIEVPKPVYKEMVDGEEQIVYNSNSMELDKLYEIEFNNQHWGLRKTDKEIEFFKFEPNES